MNPVKYFTLSLIIFSFNTAQAAKPETADSPPAHAKQVQQPELEKAEKKIKETTERTAEKKQSEAKKKMSDASDKTDAVAKEAGKGSDQGQKQREAHSRTWWKFWDQSETDE